MLITNTVQPSVFAVLAVVAGLAAGSPGASLPGGQPIDVQLTGGHDSALGGGTAFIMGPSLISTPSQRFVDTVNELYLQPHGFTGTAVSLTTPEAPAHLGASEAEGARILTEAIQNEIAGGQVDAENPVVVFGYSQSAAFVTFTMEQLHEQGVPSEDVHFVLVGDPANPNGGILNGFDVPPGTVIPILDIPLGNPTPDNLYPVDIYTAEYDGFADAAHYPFNLFAWANAFLGLALVHTTYLGLDPEQIASAVPLETTGDTLTNYYMIPSETLPLLAPVQWLPVIGTPLYELLEPVTRILVNLGYDSIAEGWRQGPANVPTPTALFPDDLNWSDILTALGKGLAEGVSGYLTAWTDPATYQLTPLVEEPSLASIVAAAYAVGIVDTPNPSSVADVLGALLTTFFESMDAANALAPTSDLGDLLAV